MKKIFYSALTVTAISLAVVGGYRANGVSNHYDMLLLKNVEALSNGVDNDKVKYIQACSDNYNKAPSETSFPTKYLVLTCEPCNGGSIWVISGTEDKECEKDHL